MHPGDDDTASRVEAILDKVDREVARRRGLRPPEDAPTPAPPAAPIPTAAVAAPAGGAEPLAPASPAAAGGPEPLAPALASAPGDPAPSISMPGAGLDPGQVGPIPTTTAELASGIAAARRRLQILNAQVDDLAQQVALLAQQTPRGAFGLPGEPIAPPPAPGAPPVVTPDFEAAAPLAPAGEPPAEAEGPAAPATPDDADPAAAAPPGSEPEPEPEPAPAPPPLPPRASGAGMSVRPRPPAQHRRTVPPGDQARLVAVELAVAGYTRGEVEEILREDRGLEAPPAVLDSLFGAGTGPAARMIGT